MDWRAIGKRIRQQREFMGLTREQFAEQIDVTPKFCSDIEAGRPPKILCNRRSSTV